MRPKKAWRSGRFVPVLVALVLLMPGVMASPGDGALRSPWDLHPVATTDAPYACPDTAQLPRDFVTNSYYTDSHHSIIDPALKKRYEDSVAPIEDFSRAVVKAADTYQTKGSRAAAQCASTLLENAAKQKALSGQMGSAQAYYVQGWNLGTWAVAYLKVRGSGGVSSEQSQEIAKWLKKLAQDNRGYYEERRHHSGAHDAYNNHLYWAGFAISATAIASNDRGLFRWGMDAYRQGARDIGEDGTLPLEMDRGQMALHYHLYALAPLVMLAELGAANDIDLYAERDFAIKRLVARSVAGLQDPSFFQEKTGVPQVTTPEIAAWEIGWAQPYARRFPDPKLSELMAQAPRLSYTTWGGLPPP
jgi:poly(beta-D-mannuronate) lyase